MVKEEKSPVRKSRQAALAEGFNSGVKGLTREEFQFIR
jgi:hypothetical protein